MKFYAPEAAVFCELSLMRRSSTEEFLAQAALFDEKETQLFSKTPLQVRSKHRQLSDSKGPLHAAAMSLQRRGEPTLQRFRAGQVLP